jgi:hypothetical protein
MNYNWFGLPGHFGYSDGSHGPKDRNDWEAIDLTYFEKTAEGVEGITWRQYI